MPRTSLRRESYCPSTAFASAAALALSSVCRAGLNSRLRRLRRRVGGLRLDLAQNVSMYRTGSSGVFTLLRGMGKRVWTTATAPLITDAPLHTR